MTRVTTGHHGSQRGTNLTKTYINMVSLGHKARHKSQMLMAGVAQEPCDPGHNASQRVITAHNGSLAHVLAPCPPRSLKSAQDKSFATFFSACQFQCEKKCLQTKFYLCCGLLCVVYKLTCLIFLYLIKTADVLLYI